MNEPEFKLVKFVRDGDRMIAQLTGLIDEHVERVWAALTEPPMLVQWLAPGHVDPYAGGVAALDFSDSGIVIDSPVTAAKPCRLLQYSWSGPGDPTKPLTWTLEAIGPMTQLTLTLDLPADEHVARACAGWAAHLDMLIAALADTPIKFPFETFKAARDAYGRRMPEQGEAGPNPASREIRLDEGLWATSMLPEGVVEQWVAKDGGLVAAGQHVADVRIEGAVHDVIAPAAGRLQVRLAANAVVEPGAVLGSIATG